MHKVLGRGRVGLGGLRASKLADARVPGNACRLPALLCPWAGTAYHGRRPRSPAPSRNTCGRRSRRVPASRTKNVRLAKLYFERKAPTITNACQILADKALPSSDRAWHFAALHLNGRCRQAVGDAGQADRLRGFSGSGQAEDVSHRRFTAMWEGQNARIPAAASTRRPPTA